MTTRSDPQQVFRSLDLHHVPVDQKRAIAEVTCVMHPEGVTVFTEDSIPVDHFPQSALNAISVSNVPVTVGHGRVDIFARKWIEKPEVVGHITGRTIDEDGRILCKFVLNDSSSATLAHNAIRSRKFIDVSPIILMMPNPNPRDGNKFVYHLNSLALCEEGRRLGTHILSMKSRLVEKNSFRLKNKAIVDQNKTTRRATDSLFTGESDMIFTRTFYTQQKHPKSNKKSPQ